MPRDNFTLEQLAGEMARCARRNPEYRMPPGRAPVLGPIRIIGIVDGHAVVRGKRAAPSLMPIKDFDQWPETDKDGNPLNGD